MKAVPGYSHLARRGAVYWMRRRVPTDLTAHLPFPEWKESLRTKDLEDAKRLLRLRLVEIDREIAAARAKVANTAAAPLTVEDAHRLAESELVVWMQEDAFWRLENGVAAYDTAAEILEKAAPRIRRAYAVGDWRDAVLEAEDALERSGRWYPAGDPSISLLAQELLKARARFVELLEKRQRGEVAEVPDPRPVIQSRGQQPHHGGKTLADLIRDYRAARELEHGEESTRRKYSHIFRALEEVLGRDTPIAAITRSDCRDVIAFLQRVPASAGKKYPGMSLKEAVEAGQRDGARTLAPNTVASYVQNLSALFNWAVEEDLLPKSPVRGLVGKGRANVKRRGFTAAELRTLFAGVAANRTVAPAQFWVPALALFSGARLNELCQLDAADIGEADQVSFIDFSEFDAETGERVQDRSLKTEASDRRVPVHEELIAAGFLDFVASVRQPVGGRLFPELSLGPDGLYSHGFSKWFGRYLDRVKLSARALVFHSFRHGFRDACREAGISTETAEALGGWVSAGASSSYGNRSRLALLARESAKVAYPGFKLTEFARAGAAADH